MSQLNVEITGNMAVHTVAAYQEKLIKHPGDCGVDLYPRIAAREEISLAYLAFYTILSIPTDTSILIPEGYFGLITSRSSSVDKLMGCMIVPGIIDHGFTGEYKIRVQVPNIPDRQLIGRLGQLIVRHAEQKVALAQLIILPYAQANFIYREELSATGRGSHGFGSTDMIRYDGVPSERLDSVGAKII